MSLTQEDQSYAHLLADVPMSRRPRHVAIIMDGNGRWAQMRGLPRHEGHLRGVDAVRRTLEGCRDFGIQALTLFCLSSENWKRPPQELEFLMTLLREYLIAERQRLVEYNLRLRIIGRRERLPKDVQHEMQATLDACANNTGMTLCLAINYGGRAELIDAMRSLGQRIEAGELTAEEIDEEHISGALYTAGLPDPDLMIRTSGEMRISNFLLWQLSYAELWVTDVLWPQFTQKHLAEAIRDYSRRQRRFGGLGNTDAADTATESLQPDPASNQANDRNDQCDGRDG